MSDIDSSRWMGPPDGRDDFDRFGAPVHRTGQPAASSIYKILAAGRYAADRRGQKAAFVPSSLAISAALLLVLTPVLLFIAWSIVAEIGHDFIVRDNSEYLWSWAALMMLLAAAQFIWRGSVLARARTASLLLALAATVAGSVGYVYLAVTSKAHAVASAPERVFEVFENRGSRRNPRTVVLFQRADGTILGGGSGAPIRYGYLRARTKPDRLERFHVGSRDRQVAGPRPYRAQLADPVGRLLQQRRIVRTAPMKVCRA